MEFRVAGEGAQTEDTEADAAAAGEICGKVTSSDGRTDGRGGRLRL